MPTEGWHFLTGKQDAIKRLADAVGFHYKYDPITKQFAHASGIMVLTPEGKMARYYYGIDYKPRDLRLGLVEASTNKIGSPADELLLFCFHYDPMTGKYGLIDTECQCAASARPPSSHWEPLYSSCSAATRHGDPSGAGRLA